MLGGVCYDGSMVAVPVNYLAVILAAVASMVLGFLWYGPVFGKQWMALSGINPGNMDPAKKAQMNKLYAMAFVGSLVMAYVTSHALVFASSYTETTGVSAGLMVGFWNWLGFIAPVTLGGVLWENKSWKLWGFNNAYHLVNLLLMGVILALWPA